MEHNEIQSLTTEYTGYSGSNTDWGAQPIPPLIGDLDTVSWETGNEIEAGSSKTMATLTAVGMVATASTTAMAWKFGQVVVRRRVVVRKKAKCRARLQLVVEFMEPVEQYCKSLGPAREDHGGIEGGGNGARGDSVNDNNAVEIHMGSGEVDGGGREESKVWRSWLESVEQVLECEFQEKSLEFPDQSFTQWSPNFPSRGQNFICETPYSSLQYNRRALANVGVYGA
ncbi:hypothetical protein DFH08DRAFT_810561 [Mycena albidolilacea]|uniref:Uncharacterized protein n=1 Tax=Mycena albidolilacea TaxID=1033008 RepID=A0AAD7EQ64_9AGAR|nr:hypothetical protein DFH08DRAFT_810561 [Mycena albidolilacea]